MADQEAAVVDGAAPDQNDAQAESPVPGEEALGDPGKKALDAMKAERNAAKAEAKARADEIAALKAKIEGREAEYQAEQERRNVEAAALAKANERIVRSEIKAAAKGVLRDPADAFRFLDASTFAVDENGDVDESAIAQALVDLVESKPYLGAGAAQSPRFQGPADQGARSGAGPKQLSKDDVDRMYAERRYGEIEAARQAGLLNNLLGVNQPS